MPRKITRLAALAATLVAGLSAVSSASAATWQSNGTAGGTPFTASDPGLIVVRSALPNGFGYNCRSGTLAGSLFGPTGPASTTTWANVETFTPAFATCSIAGVPVTISGVGPGHFDATSYSGGVTHGRFYASWTATWVTCPFTVSIDAPATSDGTAITLGQTQSGTVSWPSGSRACDNITGTTGGGSSNVRLINYSGGDLDAVYSYGSFVPSIFY